MTMSSVIFLQMIYSFLWKSTSVSSNISPGKFKWRRPLTRNPTLGKSPVQQVREHRFLRVIIDQELKWQSHIDNIRKHLSGNLFVPSQLRHYVDSDTHKIFFQAHLLSHIDYASTVWSDASEVHLKKLYSLHRRAAKLILPDKSVSSRQKLNKLNIVPLHKQLKCNQCVTIFKIHTGKAPALSECLSSLSSCPVWAK